MSDSNLETKLERAYQLFIDGEDSSAIRLCESILTEFAGNSDAIDSVLSQLVNFGHGEKALRLVDEHSIGEEQIVPEVFADLKKVEDSLESPGKRTSTWRRQKFFERGDMSLIHRWDPAFARRISVSEVGVEVKRFFRTTRFKWSEVSEAKLQPREALAAAGSSVFTYRRVLLTFKLDGRSESVDVSSFRPEFSNPAEIIDLVRTYVPLQECPIVRRTKRQRIARAVFNGSFFLALVLVVWYLKP